MVFAGEQQLPVNAQSLIVLLFLTLSWTSLELKFTSPVLSIDYVPPIVLDSE